MDTSAVRSAREHEVLDGASAPGVVTFGYFVGGRWAPTCRVGEPTPSRRFGLAYLEYVTTVPGRWPVSAATRGERRLRQLEARLGSACFACPVQPERGDIESGVHETKKEARW